MNEFSRVFQEIMKTCRWRCTIICYLILTQNAPHNTCKKRGDNQSLSICCGCCFTLPSSRGTVVQHSWEANNFQESRTSYRYQTRTRTAKPTRRGEDRFWYARTGYFFSFPPPCNPRLWDWNKYWLTRNVCWLRWDQFFIQLTYHSTGIWVALVTHFVLCFLRCLF